jgi:hypothetical protein
MAGPRPAMTVGSMSRYQRALVEALSSYWSAVRAQPMIRLDSRLILSSPISICVFCVFCGSIFLVYCRHNLANSLAPAKVAITG